MTNSLGLDDDLESVEMVLGVEAAFAIRMTDVEAETLLKVEDIYRLLRERFASLPAARRCANAMTYFRLRGALADLNVDRARIRPETLVEDLSPLNAKMLFRQISAISGLRLPGCRLTRRGVSGSLLIVAGVLSAFAPALFGPDWWLLTIVLLAGGITLFSLDPKQAPPDGRTVGDLSRKVAALNFGTLVNEGAEPRDRDLWNALVEVLSEYSTLPKSEITPETLLLQSQLRSA